VDGLAVGAVQGADSRLSALALDGAHGEGGGQLLRTAVALAVALGRPLALTHVRMRRPKPGLRPQHLAVVRALASIADAEVSGDALGSTELRFVPRAVRPGDYTIDVAATTPSAGSVTLLFQALLLPLALAGAPSHLVLRGGTHVPWSPVVPYLTEVFLPALASIGLRADVTLRRWGWYPAGGGEIEARIEPWMPGAGFVATSPVDDAPVSGLSAVSRLPLSIAERQRRRAEERLGAAGVVADIALQHDDAAHGPGTLIFLAAQGRAGFSALGRRGVPAEQVADTAVDALLAWRASGAAVDTHLADQLVPFVALADGHSRYTCPGVTSHLRTVAWVVRQFLPVEIVLADDRPALVRIEPRAHGGLRAPPKPPGARGTPA
jgi:RNA 3'-terminal phosphate cyclase (ATP)